MDMDIELLNGQICVLRGVSLGGTGSTHLGEPSEPGIFAYLGENLGALLSWTDLRKMTLSSDLEYLGESLGELGKTRLPSTRRLRLFSTE